MKQFSFREQDLELQSLVIEGNRIILQAINASYSSEIFKEFTTEITRYMSPRPPENINETLLFISEAIDGMVKRQDLILVIIEKATNSFLGCCGLHGKDNAKTPELGLWLKKSAHGQKYGREAITTLTSWVVENIEFDYLIYPVDKANVASRKIPESLGGVIFEEKKVKSMSGNILDEVVYRITIETLKDNITRS